MGVGKKDDLVKLYMSHQSSDEYLTPAKLLENIEPATPDSIRSLRIALGNAALPAIKEFIEAAGVGLVLGKFAQFLIKEKKTKTDHEILKELVECFFGIGNMPLGCQVCTKLNKYRKNISWRYFFLIYI